MFVYFIFNSLTKNFKIGKTKSIERRLKQLQTGNEIKLEVTRQIEYENPEIEKYLHEYYADRRLHGEWFDVTLEEIDYIIDLIKKIYSNPNIKLNNPKNIRLQSRILKYKNSIPQIKPTGVPLSTFLKFMVILWIVLMFLSLWIHN